MNGSVNMATLGGHVLLLVALLLFLVDSAAGSFCSTGTYTYSYCSYGCCGSYPYGYCCSSNVGLIVGCVFAGIVVVCIIVALICVCVKKSGQPGRVVHPTAPPATRSNVTVIHAGGYAHPPPPPHTVNPYQPMGGMPVPPNYKPQGPPPPAYTYSDPAYPPGATPNAPNPPNPPNPFTAYAANYSQPPASTSGNTGGAPGVGNSEAAK